MNEMKILIKAITSDAKKNISKINEELEKVKQTADKSGKSLDLSMKTIAKGAAVAAGAIAAVSTALVAFGKSTLEAQKEIAKLNTAFLAAGSTTKQASKTYQDLYRFMGDAGAATEAAQQLALITTSEQELTEWTKILQGVYATMGSTLPIESLAEAANETIKVGQVTGTFADALNWAGVSEDEFNAKLAQTTSLAEREALIRGTLNSLYMNAANIYERNNSALLAYNQSQAQLDIALAQTGQAVLPLLTALNNLIVTLLVQLKPAIEIVVAALIIFIEAVSIAVKWISAFFSIFSGGGKATKTASDISSSVAAVGKNSKMAVGGVGGLNKALDGAASAAKELKKQTMGFDELNVMSSQPAASAGGGGGGISGAGVEIPDMSSLSDLGLDNLVMDLEEAREKATALMTIVGIIASIFVLWKLTDFLIDLKNAIQYLPQVKQLIEKMGEAGYDTTPLKETKTEMEAIIQKAKLVGGTIMIIAGAILLVQGYCDAWVNGIDWANFAAVLGGIALIVGGLGLVFGAQAAGIGALAGGIAMIVLGIKDFIENGYSLEAVLTIAAGALLVLVGVCLAFNAALLANPITWVIAAIVALAATFVILWNECEGFRNFWIMIWEAIKTAFNAVVESLKPLFKAIVNAFQEAWKLIQVVWDLVAPYFSAAWDGIKAAWGACLPFFKAIWDGIKLYFSVVKEWFTGMFKAAWEGIKFIWNTVVSYFTAIWDSIAGVFSVVRNVLTGNWSEAWEGIKGIVNTWVEFFKGVWDGIKNVFGSVADWFGNTFKKAWEAVKKVFQAGGKVFDGIKDGIVTTFKTIVNALIEGINKVVKLPFEGLNKILDKIKGISVAGIKPFNWLTWRAPVPQLPKLAKGGVVDSATIAMFGEAGKEAVIPLENNTEWMDILADRIASRNNNPTKVILKVGEKELGWATIGAINGITEQTGGLQLVL